MSDPALNRRAAEPRSNACRYPRYVVWVGAVALVVGVGLATPPAAWADHDDDNSSSDTSPAAPAPDGPGPRGTEDTEPDGAPEPHEPHHPDGAHQPNDGDDDTEPPAQPEDNTAPPDTAEEDSSGGAVHDGGGGDDALDSAGDAVPETVAPVPEVVGGTQVDDTVVAVVTEQAVAEPVAAATVAVEPAVIPVAALATPTQRSSDYIGQPTLVVVIVDPVVPPVDFQSLKSIEPSILAPILDSNREPRVAAPTSVDVVQEPPAQDQLATQVPEMSAILASAFLPWSASTLPGTPAPLQTPFLWAVLAWTRRQAEPMELDNRLDVARHIVGTSLDIGYVAEQDEPRGDLATVIPIRKPADVATQDVDYPDLVAGPAGAVAYTTTEGGVSTITVVRPERRLFDHQIDGFPAAPGVFAPDGTFYQTTVAGTPATGFTTTVTLIRPDETIGEVDVTGSAQSPVAVGVDGTVAQVARTYSPGGDTYTTSLVVVHVDSSTTEATIPGASVGPAVVGADGTTALVATEYDETSDSFTGTLVVVRPDGTVVHRAVTGYPHGGTVIDDGTAYQATSDGVWTVDLSA